MAINEALLSQLHPAVISSINAVDVNYTSPVGVSTLFCADTFQCGVDNKIQYVSSVNEFISKYGEPNLNKFGQGAYNVYRWLEAGGDARILRILPDDASYAHAILNIKTKDNGTKNVLKASGDTSDLATIKNVYLKPVISYTNVNNINDDTLSNELNYDRDNDSVYTDGYKDHFIMLVKPLGRGKYYNDFGFRLTLNKSFDNLVESRCYNFETIKYDENGNYSTVEGPFYVTFDPDSLSDSNESMFIEDVVNKYSEYITVEFNTEEYLKVANIINPNVNPYILDIIYGETREPNGFADSFYCEDTKKNEDVHIYIQEYNNRTGEPLYNNGGEIKRNIVDYDKESEYTILSEDTANRKEKYNQIKNVIDTIKEIYVNPSISTTANNFKNLFTLNNNELVITPVVSVESSIDTINEYIGGLTLNSKNSDSEYTKVNNPETSAPITTYLDKLYDKAYNYIDSFKEEFTIKTAPTPSNTILTEAQKSYLSSNYVTSYIVSLREIINNVDKILDVINTIECYNISANDSFNNSTTSAYETTKLSVKTSNTIIKEKISLYTELQIKLLALTLDIANTESADISVDKLTAIEEIMKYIYDFINDIDRFNLTENITKVYRNMIVNDTDNKGLVVDIEELLDEISMTSSDTTKSTKISTIFVKLNSIVELINSILNFELVKDTAELVGITFTIDTTFKIEDNTTSLVDKLIGTDNGLLTLMKSDYDTINGKASGANALTSSAYKTIIKRNISELTKRLQSEYYHNYNSSLQNFNLPVPFNNGSDGSIDPTIDTRRINKKNLLIRAYSGLIDEDVVNRDITPFDHIIDANYDNSVKLAIANLARNVRKDFFFWCDTGFTASPRDCIKWRENDFNVNTQYMGIFSQDLVYYDNFTAKDCKFTSGYVIANKVPTVIMNNGIQYPIAGPRRGLIDGFKSISWIPNETYKESLYRHKVNYIEQDTRRTKIGSQLTALDKNNPLSNINNMLVLLNIKKNVENIVSNYQFEFNDKMTHTTMSYDLNQFLARYVENRSCETIQATVSATDYDKQQKIVRVNVTIKFNNIIERIVVSFDVAV